MFSSNDPRWSNSNITFNCSSGEIYLSWRALIGLAFGHSCKARQSYVDAGEDIFEGSHFCDNSFCLNYRHFMMEKRPTNGSRNRGCSCWLKRFEQKKNSRTLNVYDYQFLESTTGKRFCWATECGCVCHWKPEPFRCFWHKDILELGVSTDHTRDGVEKVKFFLICRRAISFESKLDKLHKVLYELINEAVNELKLKDLIGSPPPLEELEPVEKEKN